MNESIESLALSATARARQQAMLPGLLVAVRRRRARRQAVRAVVAAVLLVALVLSTRSLWNPERIATPDRGAQQARAPGWTTFRDDPTAVARYTVSSTRRAEWFVDDDGLSALLRQAGRSPGIVRAGGRVEINRAAIDPWPQTGAE